MELYTKHMANTGGDRPGKEARSSPPKKQRTVDVNSRNQNVAEAVVTLQAPVVSELGETPDSSVNDETSSAVTELTTSLKRAATQTVYAKCRKICLLGYVQSLMITAN